MQLCRGISLEELRLPAQRLRFLVTSAVPAQRLRFLVTSAVPAIV